MPIDAYGDPLPANAQYRLGSQRFRHPTVGNGLMACVAFSPNGRWLASGAKEGGGIVLFEAETGRRIWFWENEDQGRLQQLVFSPDSRWVIALPYGNPWRETVAAWSIETGRRVAWEPLDKAEAIAFDAAGETLALADSEQIHIYRFGDRHPLANKRRPIPDSSSCRLLVGGDFCYFANLMRGLLLRWRYREEAVELWSFQTPEKPCLIEHAFLSPDEQTLAVASSGEPVLLDPRDAKPAPPCSSPLLADPSRKLHFLDRKAAAWNACKLITDAPHQARFTPDGQTVAFTERGGDRTLHLKLQSVSNPASRPRVFKNATDFQHALAFSPDSRYGVFFEGSGDYYNDAVLWDLVAGKTVQRYRPGGMPMCLDVSAAGDRIAVACRDGQVDTFESPSGRRLSPHAGGCAAVTAFAIEDSQRWAATVNENRLHYWSLEEAGFWKATVPQTLHGVHRLTPRASGDIAISHTDSDRPSIALLSWVRRETAELAWTKRLEQGAFEAVRIGKDGVHCFDRQAGVERIFAFDSGEEIASRKAPDLQGRHPIDGLRDSLGLLAFEEGGGLSIQENETRTPLACPPSFDSRTSWLIDAVRSSDGSRLACFYADWKDERYSCLAMAWDLERPGEVNSMLVPYYDDGKYSRPALAFDVSGRCLLAFFEPSESRYEDEPFSHLEVRCLDSAETLLRVPEIDRVESGLPDYEMRIAFGNQGESLGCAIDNRLLIWSNDSNRMT